MDASLGEPKEQAVDSELQETAKPADTDTGDKPIKMEVDAVDSGSQFGDLVDDEKSLHEGSDVLETAQFSDVAG